jgi:hypothetical protein
MLPAALLAQAGNSEKCSVGGQVVSAASNEPVRKASVTLRRADRNPGTEGPPPSYSAVSDAGGRFSIADVEPGRYHASVRRTGFVDTEYGARGPMRAGTILTLSAGQRVQDVNFRLTPHGVITGRVLDEDGDPVAYARVEALRPRYNQGRRQMMSSNGGSTDDLGEYRIFGLPPGKYYLSASNRNGPMLYPAGDRTSAAGDEDYAPTWYPGTTDMAAASAIDVLPGAQMRGINFTLAKMHTLRVRGRVTNAAGGGRQNINVMLMPRDRLGGMTRNSSVARDNGQFEVRGVVPGPYTLVAMIPNGDKTLSVRQSLDVGSANIDNVLLTITPGADIAGRVRADGQATPSLTAMRLSLQSAEIGGVVFGPIGGGTVKEDGSFTLSNVSPDRYSVYAFGTPDGYWVKSIRLGSEDVTDQPLDFTHGAAGELDILISPTAGQIEGTVMSPKQEPAPGATVVLIPQAPNRRGRGQYYKTTTSDQFGHFILKNAEPGDYKAYAWEDVEPGAYMDPDFVKPVENRGESITIHESGREKIQLELIPAETTP